jgi:hypothetical protein
MLNLNKMILNDNEQQIKTRPSTSVFLKIGNPILQ